MSINLEEQITYELHIGTSLKPNSKDLSEFHLVSRQLPRTTTKVARETLENGQNSRVRISAIQDAEKRNLLMEADSPDLKSSCTFEGDFELVSSPASDNEDADIPCILIYDDELQAFTIEKLSSMPVIKSGVPSSVSAAANGSAATGMLALPTNRHNSSKDKQTLRRESESMMDDELEDKLAKELEGMLDDDGNDSDTSKANRHNSARQTESKRSNSEDQLNKELDASLDEALFEAVASDEDEFEEVDGSQVLAATSDQTSGRNMTADSEGLFGRRSTMEDDDEEEMFEEIDPSAALDGTEFSPQNSRIGGSVMEEDSDQFEEISGSRINSMVSIKDTGDDALFSESLIASPLSYSDNQQQQQSDQRQSEQQSTGKVSESVDNGNDSADDEFEDLNLDLACSLDSN
ncbi:hypothetical protein IWW36_000376 [Coemansia brasiliensis]|uniref:Transcription elongation factor Eaf N-terminal domain-containing protein n=1 Tax=Coemansia brasiliensis TaxID=2650707 RepID=A0A9W8LZY5_9FUNG|nr:hypothetical protein IWW36_000376 [Coemansia brasiliensis]